MPFLKRVKSESVVNMRDKRADKNGLLHTVFTDTGDQYTGEWKDNYKHGKGIQVSRRGTLIYEGDWKHGVRDGVGNLRKLHPLSQQHVRVYSGQWKKNKKEGHGTYFYSSSSRYEGEWVQNKRSGWGKMYYEDGSIYEGAWLKDKPHGQGVLLYGNGNRHEGQWKNGMKNGFGRFFYPDKGQVYEGIWLDDMAKCGTLYDYQRDQAPTPSTHLQAMERSSHGLQHGRTLTTSTEESTNLLKFPDEDLERDPTVQLPPSGETEGSKPNLQEQDKEKKRRHFDGVVTHLCFLAKLKRNMSI